MIKFSVVIPTYNRADLLIETVKSILSQSYPVSEIIIIDDGSMDDTGIRVKALNNPLIKYTKQANTGQNIARHNGVLAAENDWVALCDSDDLWLDDHIERLVTLIQSFPDSDFVFSNFTEFGNSSRYSDKFASAPQSWDISNGASNEQHFRQYDASLFYQLLNFTPVFPSALAFRKSKYIEYRAISENLKGQNLGAEDFYTTLIFAAKGKVASDSQITTKIRKHDENHSGSNVKNMEGEVLIIEEVVRQLEKDGVQTINKNVVTKAIDWRLKALAYHYFANRDKENFDRVYRLLSGTPKLFLKKAILYLSHFI